MASDPPAYFLLFLYVQLSFIILIHHRFTLKLADWLKELNKV